MRFGCASKAVSLSALPPVRPRRPSIENSIMRVAGSPPDHRRITAESPLPPKLRAVCPLLKTPSTAPPTHQGGTVKVIRPLICSVTCALTGACDARTDAIVQPSPIAADVASVAADRFSDWAEPVNVGPVVNSPFTDFTPELSRDGLSLYFSSNRPRGFGLTD